MTDPGLMEWMIAVKDPFFLYENGKVVKDIKVVGFDWEYLSTNLNNKENK